MTEELLDEYIRILESNKKQEGEYTVGDFAAKAKCSKETAEVNLEKWVKQRLWSKRESLYGSRTVVYYRPLKSPEV